MCPKGPGGALRDSVHCRDVEPDEMEEFMSAIGRTTAYIAARREYHSAQLHSKPVIRGGLISTVACQASTGI